MVQTYYLKTMHLKKLQKAISKKTGARGLRSILENILVENYV